VRYHDKSRLILFHGPTRRLSQKKTRPPPPPPHGLAFAVCAASQFYFVAVVPLMLILQADDVHDVDAYAGPDWPLRGMFMFMWMAMLVS